MQNFDKIEKEYKKEQDEKLEKQIKQELEELDKQQTQIEIRKKRLKENPKEYFVEKSGAVYVVNGKVVDKDVYEKHYEQFKEREEWFNKKFKETWKDFFNINSTLLLD
jgi:ribosomal protein L18E